MAYALAWESDTTLYCRFYGTVDFADLTDATAAFFHDFRSDRIRQALWDFTAMTEFEVNHDQASEIAATDFSASCYMNPLKAAFITTDAAFAALARQYIEDMAQFGSRWQNRLFATVAEARSWMAADDSGAAP